MVKHSSAVLYYVHDPMCSWCWGFRPAWLELKESLENKLDIVYLLGGLAPDNNDPMSQDMRNHIRNNWRSIEQEIPGTIFNYEFWANNEPRRSTYPACRAIIASRMQNTSLGHEMLYAIQQAYYLNAENPSNVDILITLAKQIGLDVNTFIKDINSDICEQSLLDEVNLSRKLFANSFPSLVIEQNNMLHTLEISYNDSQYIFSQVIEILNSKTTD